MKADVAGRLIALNRDFYATVAEPFARSRSQPQPGFARLLDFLPRPCRSLLDVGCGEGRYGRFMQQQLPDLAYTGVDFSAALLDQARATTAGRFLARDLTQPDSLTGLGPFDLVACLATLHHVPGRARRVQLLREMARCVQHGASSGRLFVSTWQFLDSERQRRKLRPWSAVGLSQSDVESGDFLLSWQRGVTALRYACHIDADALAALAADAGLGVVAQFRSDGREGDLSLYAVLEAA